MGGGGTWGYPTGCEVTLEGCGRDGGRERESQEGKSKGGDGNM